MKPRHMEAFIGGVTIGFCLGVVAMVIIYLG